MEERRAARTGTVSGLALLTGGTALIAAGRGAHSFFATTLLCLLCAGLAHALLDEIRRQARRRTARWAVADTVNAVLLAVWTAGAAVMAALAAPVPVRVVGMVLTGGYALSCAYFITERRRTMRRVAAPSVPPTPMSANRSGGTEATGMLRSRRWFGR